MGLILRYAVTYKCIRKVCEVRVVQWCRCAYTYYDWLAGTVSEILEDACYVSIKHLCVILYVKYRLKNDRQSVGYLSEN